MDIDKIVEVILGMCTAEQLANDKGKTLVEGLFNEILKKERDEFLKGYERGENRSSGFNNRTLKLGNGWKLNLRVPRVRKDSSKLHYTLFNKYKRHTDDFENKIEDWYKSGITEKNINKMLKISCIPQEDKKAIRNKYVKLYKKWLEENKEGFEVVKVDATEFNKKHWKADIYTLYTIWGYKKNDCRTITKCLGYFVKEGKECSKHWEEVIKYMDKFVDLESIKLIISDMNSGLKYQLGKLNKPLQNCLWHRLRSISVRIKGITKSESEDIFYSEYKRLSKIDSIEQLKELLLNFDVYEYRVEKNKSGVEVQRDFNRMISHYYDDNFTYFQDKDLLDRYGAKLLRQTMDVESLNSQIKYSMKKYSRITSQELLEFRVYCFLESNEYL